MSGSRGEITRIYALIRDLLINDLMPWQRPAALPWQGYCSALSYRA